MTPLPIRYSVTYTAHDTDDDTANAVVTSPRSGSYCVIFAFYKDGALTGIDIEPAVFAEAGELTVKSSHSLDSADRLNIMLWSSLYEMVPLACDEWIK